MRAARSVGGAGGKPGGSLAESEGPYVNMARAELAHRALGARLFLARLVALLGRGAAGVELLIAPRLASAVHLAAQPLVLREDRLAVPAGDRGGAWAGCGQRERVG